MLFHTCYLSWRCHTLTHFASPYGSMVFIIVYYSWSKSIISTKVRNESRCFMIRSCLLAGQCPAFVAFLFIAFLFGSSRGQWYRRWSIVCSPCSQAHVARRLSIMCGGRLCSTAGQLREKRLHSVIRWLAVCAACSGQLQVGEGPFFNL